MAKSKNKLNKTNSSGWLDNYSEEFSISEYQDGGKLKQYFNLPTKRVAVDNTYNKNSLKLDSSDDKEMVNRLLREKANESQKAKEKRIADVKRLEELNKKSMLETANAKDLYDIGEGMKSKYRFSNEDNFFDDYINPFNMVGGMAGGLAQTPELINQGEYGNAALNVGLPLTVGALAGIGTQNAGQFVNNLVNPFAGTGNLFKRTNNLTFSVDDVNNLKNQFRKNLFSDEEKKMYEKVNEIMRFDKLPQTTNKQSVEVLDNFKQRIKTPEGQKRLKDLGITEKKLLQDLKIVEDPNTYGHYTGLKNTIAINPNHPLPKKVVRHEIEHGVQNALYESKLKKEDTWKNTFKQIFSNPFNRKYTPPKSTTEIDDILSGLTLRREGTPNIVWDYNDTKEVINIDDYKSLISNKQNATDYFLTGSDGAEKSAFLGEVQQYMMDQGVIPKTSYKEVTPEMVKNTFTDAMFDEDGGKYLRLFNIIKADPKNYELISKGLNKMLTAPPAAIGLGAASQFYNGQGEGEINQYAEGGDVKDKKSTLSKLKKALSLKENLGNLDTKKGYFTPLNQLLRTAVGIEGKDYSNESMEPIAREQDALRMYLGLPTKTGAFEQTGPNKYRIRDYNKLYPDTLLSDEAVRNWGIPNEDGVPDPVNPAFDLYPYDDFVMGRHYVTKGKDAKGEYLKYSDRFDFDPTRYANQFIDKNINPTMGKYLKKATPLLDELESLMFNPFELEDKIYYDPKTKLRSDIILQQNASKVYPGQPMATPPEFAKGGKVNDNNGYLISNLNNFTPKKIINSNYITTNNMAFPVAANGVVLYPNTGDYVFPTNKVTEIPIMKDGGQHGGLDRWFAEKWVDVKTGKECGRQKGEKRKGYPACRPSKRISSDTPKTASELSNAEKEKFKREKTSSKRIDYSHKKEDGGLIYNDMKNKFKKYQGGGYLDYQDAYKGFGVGPQLYQDNSYFRSVMPDNIENMEEEINKPSVFSGINDVLGAVNQGVSQATGLLSQFGNMSQSMPQTMPDISNWQAPLSGGKTDEQLNFENDQALKNAGLFNSFYPQKLPTTGSSMGPSMWKGVPFIKNGGYLRKYQNGGNMDMLPVGYPEYIHKSNVFHENYNPVPRVHFSDDTTPYDMGVNLNDLVNMYGGRVGKYQYGGMMPFYSRQRSPRVFNSNANRASAADLESAYANDFMHTKVRKDRQSFEDDKVDWGFMDWAKEPVGALTGVLSTVPIVGDITQSALGDSFLTRTGGYAVGRGVGNVGMGAAKVIGGAATGNVGMIGSGVGDVGEGVGSTIGTFQAKDALSNYDKSGYISGNRLVRSSQDFGNMMDTASGLFGNIKGGVGMVKNMGGLKGMLGNMKGGATGAKGFGNIMSSITGIRLQDGGIVDYNFNNIEEYKYGGKVSQKINKKQNKTGWLDQL